MKFLLGRKLGMTRIYDETGKVRPVTVLQAGPCTVTQVKGLDKDGYLAVQLGFGERKRSAKPELGHLAKSKLEKNVATLTEFRLTDPSDTQELKVGDKLTANVFAPGDIVNVSATSKGKGYAGVVKRHGFAGGPKTHGSDFHRAPGAIGGRWPQRVVKGRRMAGQMGASRVTVKGLEVLKVDTNNNLLAVAGAIPGPSRGLVEIRG